MAPRSRPTQDPLILTARFDDASTERFQALRDAHFPSRVNIVPAHLTLFHQLPFEDRVGIEDLLASCCTPRSPIEFRTGTPRYLGRGVAISVEAEPLVAMRQRLAVSWAAWLTRQDEQGFRPHVTVQNKAHSTEARLLYERLAIELPVLEGFIVGLDLWIYRNGPWEFATHHPFATFDQRGAGSLSPGASSTPLARDETDV